MISYREVFKSFAFLQILSKSPFSFLYAHLLCCRRPDQRANTTSTMLRAAQKARARSGLLRAPASGLIKSFSTTGHVRNTKLDLNRSTEIGAAEETQDVTTMDQLLKIVRMYCPLRVLNSGLNSGGCMQVVGRILRSRGASRTKVLVSPTI